MKFVIQLRECINFLYSHYKWSVTISTLFSPTEFFQWCLSISSLQVLYFDLSLCRQESLLFCLYEFSFSHRTTFQEAGRHSNSTEFQKGHVFSRVHQKHNNQILTWFKQFPNELKEVPTTTKGSINELARLLNNMKKFKDIKCLSPMEKDLHFVPCFM